MKRTIVMETLERVKDTRAGLEQNAAMKQIREMLQALDTCKKASEH